MTLGWMNECMWNLREMQELLKEKRNWETKACKLFLSELDHIMRESVCRWSFSVCWRSFPLWQLERYWVINVETSTKFLFKKLVYWAICLGTIRLGCFRLTMLGLTVCGCDPSLVHDFRRNKGWMNTCATKAQVRPKRMINSSWPSKSNTLLP